MAKKESYEDMVKQLQDIVESLESGQCGLEESMKSYENGVKLVNKIYKTLGEYEGRIYTIKNQKEVEENGSSEEFGN